MTTIKSETKKATTKNTRGSRSTGTKSTRAAPVKSTKPPTKKEAKKLSQIEAAVAVLAKAGQPMNCKSMVETMGQQGLWTTPGGATPEATLYTAVTRVPNLAP